MTISRAVLPSDWPTPPLGTAWLPAEVVGDKSLTLTAFAALAYLISLGNDPDAPSASPEAVADARGLPRGLVRDAYQELVDAGWLVVLTNGDRDEVQEFHVRIPNS
jgi:hypothetical protein